MSFVLAHRRRIARGVGAFVVADVITGLTGFSVIAAGALWMFSLGWIHLQSEYSAVGLPFGSSLQLELAWFGAISCLPLLGATVFLATRAYRLPKAIFLS